MLTKSFDLPLLVSPSVLGGVLVLAVVSVHFESSVLQCVVAGRAHVNKGHMGITVEKYLK